MTVTPAAEWAERARWARWHQQERTDAAHHVGMSRPTDSGDPWAGERRLALSRATRLQADAWGQYAAQAEECFRDAAEHELSEPVTP